MRVKIIVADFTHDEHQHQKTGGHPDCQAGYVDERKEFVPSKIPDGHLDIVFEHDASPLCGQPEIIKSGKKRVPQGPEDRRYRAVLFGYPGVFRLEVTRESKHIFIETQPGKDLRQKSWEWLRFPIHTGPSLYNYFS